MTASPTADLPPPLGDALLRLAPVNVFLFDTDLVCRYAAPVGDEFLGEPRERLLGRHAAEVLPPAANGLRPVLERAAREASAWQDPEYRFTHRIGDVEQPCCWSIHVQPVAVEDYRGVLVSWSDIIQQAEERESLLAEVESLRGQARERNTALISLLSDLRNAITPISGYLQVIVRRPETLGGRSPREVIASQVLPRINDVLDATDRLCRPPIYAPEQDEASPPSPEYAPPTRSHL